MSAVPFETRGIYRLGVLAKPPAAAGEKAPRARKKKKSGFQGSLLSAEAKWLWLQLRDEGGFWTAQEASELAGFPLITGQYPGTVASRYLSALAVRGHVLLRTSNALVRCYGVTTRCTPIPGFSMEPGDTSHPLTEVIQPNQLY